MDQILGNSSKNKEPRLIDRIDISLDKPVELAVWAVKKTGVRCRVVPSQIPVTFRMVRDEVEGEIVMVQPEKVWQFKNTVYLSGKAIGSRLDAGALGLTPLKMEECGIFKPDEEEDLTGADDPFMRYYLPIMAYGPRREFKMEQVIPFQDTDDIDDDPIIQAVDAHENDDRLTAYKLIGELLSQDLRCIDAHAHLGNWEFDSSDSVCTRSVEKAKRHYEAGLRIAELGFSVNAHDLLPWSYIDNRPYLRCLHGFGLCLWRMGEIQAAREIFEKMLWLNPRDNQGARFLLADIDAGKSWRQLEEE